MCSIMGYCDVCTDIAAFTDGFMETVSRGPDDSRIVDTGHGLLGFHRLSTYAGRDAAFCTGWQLCGLQRRNLRL